MATNTRWHYSFRTIPLDWHWCIVTSLFGAYFICTRLVYCHVSIRDKKGNKKGSIALNEYGSLLVMRWVRTSEAIDLWALDSEKTNTGWSLGIYLLNLFLAFLTPKFDPSIELDTQENEMEEGPALPTKADEEFKPFIRRLPEFKFWYGLKRGWWVMDQRVVAYIFFVQVLCYQGNRDCDCMQLL